MRYVGNSPVGFIDPTGLEQLGWTQEGGYTYGDLTGPDAYAAFMEHGGTGGMVGTSGPYPGGTLGPDSYVDFIDDSDAPYVPTPLELHLYELEQQLYPPNDSFLKPVPPMYWDLPPDPIPFVPDPSPLDVPPQYVLPPSLLDPKKFHRRSS